jgi:hypothetical protein
LDYGLVLGKELAGKVLFIISAVTIISALARLGWEQAIIANNFKNKIFITNIVVTSLFLFLVMICLNFYTPSHEFLNNKLYIFLVIFFANLSVNLECLLRIASNPNKTYFFALNANMFGFLLSVLLFNNTDNILVFQGLFACLTMYVALIAVEKKIALSISFIKPFSSLKYYPIGIHGAFSQNILQFGLGSIGGHALIPLAITIQKFCGLLAWPINFFIFTHGHSIKNTLSFASQNGQLKIINILFFVIAILLSILLYLSNIQLILPALILLCGYYVFSIKGDNLFVRIYRHQYRYIYSVQLVIFTILLLIRYGKFDISYYWIFIINAIYLALISSAIDRTERNVSND